VTYANLNRLKQSALDLFCRFKRDFALQQPAWLAGLDSSVYGSVARLLDRLRAAIGRKNGDGSKKRGRSALSCTCLEPLGPSSVARSTMR
jgi:hypothetical protein